MNKPKRFLITIFKATLLGLCLALFIFIIILSIIFSSTICPMKDGTAKLKLKKDVSELPLLLEKYKEINSVYPTVDQGILALVEKPTVGKVPKNYKPIMKNKSGIKDPWGTPYVLKYSKTGEPEIWTLGKDKQEGGTGKAKDFNIGIFESYPKAFRDDH